MPLKIARLIFIVSGFAALAFVALGVMDLMNPIDALSFAAWSIIFLGLSAIACAVIQLTTFLLKRNSSQR